MFYLLSPNRSGRRNRTPHYERNMKTVPPNNHKFTIRGRACTYGHLRSAENPTSGIDLNNCSISQKSFSIPRPRIPENGAFIQALAYKFSMQSERRWKLTKMFNLFQDDPMKGSVQGSTLWWTLDYSPPIRGLHSEITISPNRVGYLDLCFDS